MIKMLYANGCSLTEGSELGNAQFKYDEKKNGPSTARGMSDLPAGHMEYMETHSYPYILKNLLGIKNHMNSALGGSCNKRILRTSIIDIEQLLTAYDPSEIFVVIGWTAFDRTEIFSNHHFVQIIPSFDGANLTKDQKKYAAMYDEVIAGQLDDLLLHHLTEVLTLKNYLKNKGIRYVFSYGLTSYIEQQFDEVELLRASKNHDVTKFIDLVDYNSWALPPNTSVSADYEQLLKSLCTLCFYNFTVSNGYKQGTGLHPLDEAHNDWANVLYKYIVEHKLLG
jgi:hypothetical protein